MILYYWLIVFLYIYTLAAITSQTFIMHSRPSVLLAIIYEVTRLFKQHLNSILPALDRICDTHLNNISPTLI